MEGLPPLPPFPADMGRAFPFPWVIEVPPLYCFAILGPLRSANGLRALRAPAPFGCYDFTLVDLRFAGFARFGAFHGDVQYT